MACVKVADGSGVVGHMMVGGPHYLMPVGSKTVLFELHHYCGPVPIHKRTWAELSSPPKAFWDCYERWELGGKRIDGETCVLPEWCDRCAGRGYLVRGCFADDCPQCNGRRVEG